MYLCRRIANLDLFILKYEKYGREFPKKANMSPDSFIQCALQLAYYKLYGKLVSTYESASTRRFRQGRVDNIRANSCETLEWVKSMQVDSTTTVRILFFLFIDSKFKIIT
jgi:choline O-acetyltransferase